MFFAPPALRRRRQQVTSQFNSPTFTPATSAAAAVPATSSERQIGSFVNVLPDNEMGNNLSEQQVVGLISNGLSQLASSSSHDHAATSLLLQNGAAMGSHSNHSALTSAFSPGAAGGTAGSACATAQPRIHKKLQCRFCLETFDRKYNKDRHESRKHASELQAAVCTAAAATSMQSEPCAVLPIMEGASSEQPGPDPVRVGVTDCVLTEGIAGTQSLNVRLSGHKRSFEQAAGLSDLGATATSHVTAAAAASVCMDAAESEIEMDHNGSKDTTCTQISEVGPEAQVKRARTTQQTESAASSSASQVMSSQSELDSSLALPDDKRSETMQLEVELDEVQDALHSGMLFPDGLRQTLEATDAQVAACCTPFLSWLCLPAMTDSERVVKARRLDPKQLAPVKKNLGFLIKAMLGLKMLEPLQLKLAIFTQENVCQRLLSFLEERQVGASRIYALFLLIKKVLVFLASSESARRREYIAPSTWNSWTCVDSICSDSNTRRKQISQNRKLLGSEQSKKLAMEQPLTRVLPTADDLRMPALFGSKVKETAKHKITPAIATSAAAAHPSSATGNLTQSHAVRADANELTPEELVKIKNGCLDHLRSPQTLTNSRYVTYLVTATLCLAAAPRQQVLRQWQLGSSLIKKDDGRYWCLMLSNMNKNGKATTFTIADELTGAYDHYLTVIRPKLVAYCQAQLQHAFVFCRQTGDPVGEAFDFSDWTRSVCKELIGRPINCHAFRAALVTSYYQAGATQSQMNALADVMAHDPATARNYYYKVDAQKQALEVGVQMQRAYLRLDASAPATMAVAASGVSEQPEAMPFSFAEVAAAGAVATASAGETTALLSSQPWPPSSTSPSRDQLMLNSQSQLVNAELDTGAAAQQVDSAHATTTQSAAIMKHSV